MTHPRDTDATPWYRQFWPWFLIALPGCAVIASFATLFVALDNPHSMVDDQYYKEGLAINQHLEQDQRASKLEMSAIVWFDKKTGRISVRLQGLDRPSNLRLLLLHPVNDALDQHLDLVPDNEGLYSGAVGRAADSVFYLRLLNQDDSWRLNGSLDFRINNQVELHSQ